MLFLKTEYYKCDRLNVNTNKNKTQKTKSNFKMIFSIYFYLI